jgi:hypothetical protein
MAGQDIEDDIWNQYLGLNLPPSSARVGFRTRCSTSVQILGRRDPRLTKLALDQASRSCKLTHVSKGCFTQDLIKLSLPRAVIRAMICQAQ